MLRCPSICSKQFYFIKSVIIIMRRTVKCLDQQGYFMCCHFIIRFACSDLFLGFTKLYIPSHPHMPVLSVFLAGNLVTLHHLQGNSLQE